jgi:hypothetical protein
MDTVIQRCAGLDIGKRDLKACVRIPGKPGRRVREIRTFATTTPGLLALRDWLASHEVTTVGMEATGIIRGSNNFLPRFSRLWPSRTSP